MKHLIALLLFLFSMTAFATATEPEGKLIEVLPVTAQGLSFPEGAVIVDDDRTDMDTTTNSRLEDLKLACTDPGHFNHQNPLSKISVDCIQRTCQWGSRPHGRRPSERITHFGGQIMTDKADSHMDARYWRHTPAPRGETVPCYVMQFYCQKETVNTMMGCEELLAMDSLKSYCEANMLQLDLESFSVKVAVGEPKWLCPGLVDPRGHQQN